MSRSRHGTGQGICWPGRGMVRAKLQRESTTVTLSHPGLPWFEFQEESNRAVALAVNYDWTIVSEVGRRI